MTMSNASGDPILEVQQKLQNGINKTVYIKMFLVQHESPENYHWQK